VKRISGTPISRRHFLQTAGSLSAAAPVGWPRHAQAVPSKVIVTRVISLDDHDHGRPTLARG
jgi:hypothetical protein